MTVYVRIVGIMFALSSSYKDNCIYENVWNVAWICVLSRWKMTNILTVWWSNILAHLFLFLSLDHLLFSSLWRCRQLMQLFVKSHPSILTQSSFELFRRLIFFFRLDFLYLLLGFLLRNHPKETSTTYKKGYIQNYYLFAFEVERFKLELLGRV